MLGSHEMPMPGQIWGIIIALYLFLAGMSAGAYATAFLAQRLYPEARKIRWAGYLVAPWLVIVGLVLLMVDAEAGFFHPWRFLYLYVGRPTSIMAIGVYILTVFAPLALYRFFVTLAEVWKEGGEKRWPLKLDRLFSQPPGWLRWLVEGRPGLDFFGLVMAAATATYTALLIGDVHAVPLWNTSVLPVLFVTSAFSTGIAVTLFTAVAWDPRAEEHAYPFLTLGCSLKGLELFLLFSLLYFGWYGDVAGRAAVADLMWGRLALPFWGGLVFLGLVVPLYIELKERKHLAVVYAARFALAWAASAGGASPSSDAQSATSAEGGEGGARLFSAGQFACLLAVAGGLLLRYLILEAGYFVQFLH
ncbi:formate-dependent nitrite reductase membrane component NrfD [Brockia lithotrophica]|uniref:Formate-dependent nitrite reductase membrane component NrfD n=1 Tax=Brockia lithotrophica TaxID=933949 RepID=A0A660L7Q1_9BACL|nr:formate-dependent nitrite reductase membrane component NrfD [Brockia lithotrophica]